MVAQVAPASMPRREWSVYILGQAWPWTDPAEPQQLSDAFRSKAMGRLAAQEEARGQAAQVAAEQSGQAVDGFCESRYREARTCSAEADEFFAMSRAENEVARLDYGLREDLDEIDAKADEDIQRLKQEIKAGAAAAVWQQIVARASTARTEALTTSAEATAAVMKLYNQLGFGSDGTDGGAAGQPNAADHPGGGPQNGYQVLGAGWEKRPQSGGDRDATPAGQTPGLGHPSGSPDPAGSETRPGQAGGDRDATPADQTPGLGHPSGSPDPAGSETRPGQAGGDHDATPPTLAPPVSPSPKFPKSAPTGGGSSVPSMGSPGGLGGGFSPPSGLGGGSGLSGQGLSGSGLSGSGFPGSAGAMSPAVPPASPSTDFSRGLSAGLGGGPPPAFAPPVAPPSAAQPGGGAPAGAPGVPPVSAAGSGGVSPAGLSGSPASGSAAAPSTSGGLPAGPGGPLPPFGSDVARPASAAGPPPMPAAGAGAAAGIGGGGGAGSTAGGGAAPLPPGVVGSGVGASAGAASEAVRSSLPDPLLEAASRLVYELQHASSQYVFLDWCVGIFRTRSGVETVIVSNEGAGYIPTGVFVPRSARMLFADQGLNPEFRSRWFSWSNPADTMLAYAELAAAAKNAELWALAVSTEHGGSSVPARNAGVPHFEDCPAKSSPIPASADSMALDDTRMHRLETLNPGLYARLTGFGEGRLPDQSEAWQTTLAAADVALGRASALRDVPVPPVFREILGQLRNGQRVPAERWEALDDEKVMLAGTGSGLRPGLMVNDGAASARVRAYHDLTRLADLLLLWNLDGADRKIKYPEIAYLAEQIKLTPQE